MTGPAKRNVLLTGGIGSGKSTVGALLAARGALVIDADRVGHEVLAPSGEAYRAVRDRWPGVVDDDGTVDRARLGRIVFSDPAQLGELEAMTHPAIRRRIAALAASADAPLVVVEVPFAADFMGLGWPRIVVTADREERSRRLVERGLAPDEIAGRMAAQPPDPEWLSGSAHVIDNNGNLADLDRQVAALWTRLVDP